MSTSLEHCGLVKQRYTGLSRFQQAIFLCLACERQFPVYEHYSSGTDWDNTPELRILLDVCWGWSILEGQEPKPNMPNAHNFLQITDGLAGRGHADHPFYSVQYLADFIINEESNLAGYPAEKGQDIIDAYLYDTVFMEVTNETERLVDVHPLMTQEINRQNHDMEMVAQDDWQKVDWRRVKENMTGQSVLRL